MSRRAWMLAVVCALWAASAAAQQPGHLNRFNFNVGGGWNFPIKDLSKYTDPSYLGTVGGGLNLSRLFAVNGEYMYDNLAFKSSVKDNQGLPGAGGRLQSATLNFVFNAPVHAKWGAYAIGGVGWYQRMVEARTQTLVPGSVCQPAWVLWDVTCTNGLIATQQTLSSHTAESGGYNLGGGVTYRLKWWHARFYAEARYHHAKTSGARTSILPMTVGLRW